MAQIKPVRYKPLLPEIMYNVKKIFIFALSFFYTSCYLFAQENNQLVQYTTEYKFKEGLYLSFSQLLDNKPVNFERIISGDKNKENWLDNVLKSQVLVLLDDYGVQSKVNTDDIWGYSRNSAVYVNWNKDFYRIPYIGKISHFVATQVVRADYFADPYYSYNYGLMPQYETNKIVQNIIDFDNGKIMSFSLEVVRSYIMKDGELFKEFMQLKKRRQKQMLFMFIRKFNERNPLYLPKPEL